LIVNQNETVFNTSSIHCSRSISIRMFKSDQLMLKLILGHHVSQTRTLATTKIGTV